MNIKDHLEKLVYFDEIARLSSFKLASKNLHITQPSLSKSIKILEETIGKDLFIRKPRGVELTARGKLLYQFTQETLSQLKDLEVKLAAPDNAMAGFLRVGTYESIAINFWPRFLKGLLKKYPHLNFQLETGRSAHIQELVNAGKIDLGLIIHPKKSTRSGIEIIAKDSFYFFQSTSKKLLFDDVENAPVILMPDSLLSAGMELNQFLSFNQIKQYYLSSSLESVREMVLNGLGIGLLPCSVATPYVKDKKIKQIDFRSYGKKGLGEHSIGIIHGPKESLSPQVRTLIKELKDSNYL